MSDDSYEYYDNVIEIHTSRLPEPKIQLKIYFIICCLQFGFIIMNTSTPYNISRCDYNMVQMFSSFSLIIYIIPFVLLFFNNFGLCEFRIIMCYFSVTYIIILLLKFIICICFFAVNMDKHNAFIKLNYIEWLILDLINFITTFTCYFLSLQYIRAKKRNRYENHSMNNNYQNNNHQSNSIQTVIAIPVISTNNPIHNFIQTNTNSYEPSAPVLPEYQIIEQYNPMLSNSNYNNNYDNENQLL